MTEPLSPEYLAEIAARAESATAGPWCTDGAEIYQGDEYVSYAFWVGETCRADEADGGTVDAAFIAHARTDVPALLAEVERLRAELAARPTRDEADAEMQRATDGLREAWTSEVERLRAELTARPSRGQALADALNAAGAIAIDLDGTITDHETWSVVWDRDAERWAVSGYAAEAGESR